MAKTTRGSIEISADPNTVYDLVADVGRMGEWSPEATGSRGAATTLAVGDQFWGTNRRGLISWMTRCTVTVADRGVEFCFDVDFGPQGISNWRYEFAKTATGCRVTETWVDRRSGLLGYPVKWVGQLIIPGDRAKHNRRNIQITLERLKRAAEAAS